MLTHTLPNQPGTAYLRQRSQHEQCQRPQNRHAGNVSAPSGACADIDLRPTEEFGVEGCLVASGERRAVGGPCCAVFA